MTGQLWNGIAGTACCGEVAFSNGETLRPIQLLYVKNVILRQAGATRQELVFMLVIQNLAYEKCVEVIWAGEDGLWHTLKAEYVGPKGEFEEVWQAQASFTLIGENSLPGDIRFVSHYQVCGCDYWCPPDYQTYAVKADSGVYLGNQFPLLNLDFQPFLHAGQQYYPVTIAVHQELRPEEVSIRWTTNRWRTFSDTPAYFKRRHWIHAVGSSAPNPNRYGCAIWISQLHLGDSYQVEYALVCHAGSREYWDNNFGANYLARHDRLKILTLNLHCCQEDQQDKKLWRIARAIKDLHIDVVCLQEVGERWNDGQGDWNSNTAKILCDRVGNSYFVYADWGHIGFGQYREGTAILSRYPFLKQESRYVSVSQDIYNINARKVVMGRVHVPYFGTINIFSAHLSWWHEGFYAQFENLRRWAESKQTSDVAATFVCGDLNSAINSEGYTIASQDYEDQFFKANARQLSRVDDQRIDYIFLKKGSTIQVRSARALFTVNDYGPVSDHCGYYGEFEPRT
jgi:maltose 6'-phosphate phosphatase